MSVLWSPTGPQYKPVRGIFWKAVTWANLLASLRQPTALFNGLMADFGTVNATLQKPTAQMVGGQTEAGVVAAVLQQITATFVGRMDAGTLNVTLQKPTAQMAGGQTESGALSVAIQQLSAALNAVEQPQGVLTASLQLATVAITGGQIQSGTVAVSLQKAIASLIGGQTISGSFAVSLFQALAQLSGTSVAASIPVFDAQSTAVVGSAVSSINISLTIGVNATAYVVFSTNSSVTVSSVKTGTTNGVLVGSQTNNNSASNGSLFVYKFTGLAAGTYTFTPTMSTTTRLSGFAFSFTGVAGEVIALSSFASATTLNLGPDTLRASAMGVGLYACGVSSGTGTINTPTGGGTNLPIAQQASNRSGCTGEWSPTSGTTFGFGVSTATACAGILLYLDAVTPPTPAFSSTTPGTYTQTVPAGGTVDLIALGAGGSGSFGSSFNGNPGAAGQWGLATGLKVGTDIQAGSTITITIGAGGVGVTGSNANGLKGGDTTIQYVNMSGATVTVTGTGGAGGTGTDGSGSTSPGLRPSPVSQFITEVTYTSGTAATGGAHPAGDGQAPGASGAGMTSTSGTSPYGGNGGAWVTFS